MLNHFQRGVYGDDPAKYRGIGVYGYGPSGFHIPNHSGRPAFGQRKNDPAMMWQRVLFMPPIRNNWQAFPDHDAISR